MKSLAVAACLLTVLGWTPTVLCQPLNPAPAESPRFPAVTVDARFAPPGESNVRSSFKVADGVALVGTEETGDIYRTTNAGQTWTQIIDTDERWDISGGASNLEVIDADTVIVGTGNHSVQGYVYTLKIR